MVKPALHWLSAGSIRHGPWVGPVCRPVPDASAPAPVSTEVKVAVPPGTTCFCSGPAEGAVGAFTVGVMVDVATCPVLSATTYLMGVAVPAKPGTGSKVMVPLLLTV